MRERSSRRPRNNGCGVGVESDRVTVKLRWKILLSIVATVCALFLLTVAFSQTFWYPAILWANFTIDGHPSKDLSLYWHRGERTLVVIRHSDRGRETYFVNIGDPRSEDDHFRRSFVASCADSSIFVYKFIAVQNHEQSCQPFLVLAGEGEVQPATKIDRKLKVGGRSFEFFADDGRRITAKW
jgi:hypothetical protein